MMAGALPLRILLSSSRKTTSKRQYFDYAYFGCACFDYAQHKQHKQYKCRRFSTSQCPRTALANSLASAAKELMKYRRSTVSFSPIKQTLSTIPILFKPTHFSISGRDVKFSVIQCFDCPSTTLRLRSGHRAQGGALISTSNGEFLSGHALYQFPRQSRISHRHIHAVLTY
jgi:hypothetical protein